MADYPDSITTPRTMVNRPGVVYDETKTKVIYAEDFNKDRDEIVAIETELGTNPKGAFASVAAYLADLAGAVAGIITDFLGLTDTPDSYVDQAGKVVAVNEAENALEFIDPPAGAVAFTDLTDVPASYAGQGAKIVAVKGDVSGLEFIANATGDMLKSVYDANDDGYITGVKLPDGVMVNGEIYYSAAANNVTVEIKTAAGTNPAASSPVVVRIGGTIRTITAALSVTITAGTNFFNSGSLVLTNQAVDYFVYLGYNATDGVVLGVSRIPSITFYSLFSTTNTSQQYCKISNIAHASASDRYNVIGRINFSCSGTPNYNWSIASHNYDYLGPINETPWRQWTPAITASGSMTLTNVYILIQLYKIVGEVVFIRFGIQFDTGGVASTTIYMTMPFINLGSQICSNFAMCSDTANQAGCAFETATTNVMNFIKYAGANWGLGASRKISGNLRMYYL